MNIENTNDHPFKVVKVEESGPYAKSHPYKVEVVGGGEGGTSDFNKLDNRPKYKGIVMTGDTNIPEVVSTDSVFTTNEWNALWA